MNVLYKMFRNNNDQVDCKTAQGLMSPFIDSMASPDEIQKLEQHVTTCEPCQRQLQSYISVRNFVARVEQPALPVDLVLETRVRLSQERHKNYLERFENRVSNTLRPLALPALAGVSLTMLCFGVLLGAMISNTTVMAHERINHADERASMGLYRPVRTTNLTMIQFAGSDTERIEEPLMIQTYFRDPGRVLDYKIISGPDTPEVVQFVREQLSMATFTPATAFGKPVDSKIILSFVAVKS